MDVTLTDPEITQIIELNSAEIEVITGRIYTNENTYTEWFDIESRNYRTPITDLYLSKLPVQAITSIKSYNKGSLTKIYSSDEYYLNDNFVVKLYEGYYPNGYRVEVVYNYGYSVIPNKINKLCIVLSQIEIAQGYMISQDQEQTSFTVDGFGSVGIGEAYVTTERVLSRLMKQKDQLITEIGSLKNDIFVI